MDRKEQLWLSHSKMTAYVECPYYFKSCYIDKIPIHTKGNYNTALGNGVHKVLEEFYGQKNHSLEFMENMWEVVCRKGYVEKNGANVKPILLDEQYDFPKGEEEKKMLYNHGRKMIREYYHKNKHSFGINEVVATELNFKVEVGSIVLNGYIDRIDRTPSGKLIVFDYKTGKEKERSEVDDDYQLSLYSFVIRKMYGEVEESVCLHYLKSGNQIFSTRNGDDFKKLNERIKYVRDGILNKQYEAKKGEQCKYCLYECPLGINEKNRQLYLNSLTEKIN